MEKIRAALDKVVPQPDPEYAKNTKADAEDYRESMVSALSPGTERDREIKREERAFTDSFKTAKVCADCGEELEAVYRERRTFGFGFMGGRSWATGVLCKKCARGGFRRFGPHSFRHFGPCETCEREVFVSRSIPALRSFCSTRCGQAHYRKARRLASDRRP